jgi:hypothetical protein
MDTIKIIFLKLLLPTCRLAFWFLEITEPNKGLMVGAEKEFPT